MSQSVQTAVENHPCAGCKKLDNHPMIHTLEPQWVALDGSVHEAPSFHFDCLPGDMEYRLGTDDTHPQHWVTREAIKAARGGKHGDALRKHIGELHELFDDNHYGLVMPHTFSIGNIADPAADVDEDLKKQGEELTKRYAAARKHVASKNQGEQA